MARMELHSPTFGNQEPIPSRHSKEGGNLSPPLEWSGIPDETAELALLCEDLDAPGGTFVHWVLAGIDPALTGLAEGETPAGAVEGRNDFDDDGYGGPRPPEGDDPHRYFFTLYAASESLGVSAGASADELRTALQGKDLASATLVGTYQR